MKSFFKHSFLFLIFLQAALCFAQAGDNSGLSKGETLFKENNAADAVQVLEYEILQGQVSENTYNFLGLGYFQLEEYEKSIDAFRRGISKQPENKKLLSYNMGNTYYAMKDYDNAIELYSQSIQADSFFYEAILNRANAMLMADRLVSAKEDYELYIQKCPDDVQRERIELLIKALEEELARREEEARLLAEQNKAKWEEYDASISDKNNDEYNPDWEEVDPLISDSKNEESTEWEKVGQENPKDISSDESGNALAEEKEKGQEVTDQWESLEKEDASAYEEKIAEAEPDALENWESLSDDEVDEMKRLSEESRREREKWLAEKKRREEEQAAYELEVRKQQQKQSLEDEKKLRSELLEEMMKAEEERRKKLLEDVANSLQSADSTNLTSGAEDLLDYDLEGELD